MRGNRAIAVGGAVGEIGDQRVGRVAEVRDRRLVGAAATAEVANKLLMIMLPRPEARS
jgi:hypothetical protein